MGAITKDWLEIQFPEIKPWAFYRFIFPEGELEKAGEYAKGKYTGVFVMVGDQKKGIPSVRYCITDSLKEIDIATESKRFCICSPISYIGRHRSAEFARVIYGIVIDVDYLIEKDGKPYGIMEIIRHTEEKAMPELPRPTFIVNSGGGVHLYYIFDTPIKITKEIEKSLQAYKRELTRKCWHDAFTTTKSEREIQFESIYQGFRMPGTVTKAGQRTGERATAYLTGEKVSIEYLNRFVNKKYWINTEEIKRETTPIGIAMQKWPEWWQRKQRGEKKRWAVNRAVYDWWLREISEKGRVGHRYYCIMTLAIFAKKCSVYDAKRNPNPVTYEELEADAMGLLEQFDSMKTQEGEEFTESDIIKAMEAFNDSWFTYPRKAIAYRSGIEIQATRRNGRKQSVHLRIARNTRDVVREEEHKSEWNREGNGRKSKLEIVTTWRKKNRDGTIRECIAETGLSRATVYRHWKSADPFIADTVDRLFYDLWSKGHDKMQEGEIDTGTDMIMQALEWRKKNGQS